jgi:undecaprenyl diphosphate synthase
MNAETLTEEDISKSLYLPFFPEPDLLIRTGGESRVSNFLLWQIAYSEIIVSDILWPDFYPENFIEVIKQFNSRERRFGLTGEQIKQQATL